MRFVIFGSGGVGGFFGGRLARAGEDVWFIARGKHLEAMRSSGLHVKSYEGEFTIPPGQMTNDPQAIGHADVVLFSVKTYDVEQAARQLSPLLTESSIVISLQNGVETEETVQKIIQRGTVYGGVAYIYASITAPGEVTEWGGPRRIVFGPLDGHVDERAQRIHSVMAEAGISVEVCGDIQTELWKKFIFIASAAGVTTLARLPLGEVLTVSQSRDLFRDAMKEVEAVARAKGIAVPPSFIDGVFETLKRFNNQARASMHNDLLNEKPLEIESLSGAVIRFGEQLGVPTPIHRAIYASLLPHHLKHVKKLLERTSA